MEKGLRKWRKGTKGDASVCRKHKRQIMMDFSGRRSYGTSKEHCKNGHRAFELFSPGNRDAHPTLWIWAGLVICFNWWNAAGVTLVSSEANHEQAMRLWLSRSQNAKTVTWVGLAWGKMRSMWPVMLSASAPSWAIPRNSQKQSPWLQLTIDG